MDLKTGRGNIYPSPDDRSPGKNNTTWTWQRRRFIFLALVLPLAGLLTLVALAMERKPLIVETATPTVESAQRARNLAKDVLGSLNSQQETVFLTASEEDMNALLTLAARGVPRFSGRVKVFPDILFLTTSFHLKTGLFGDYLNMRMELLPDEKGIKIGYLRVGRLGFHHPFAIAILRGVIDLGLGIGEGSALVGSVQSLSIKKDAVTLKLRSMAQTKERLKRLQVILGKLHDIAQGKEPPWDSAMVARYYMRLIESVPKAQSVPPPSLADYLGPLFRLAMERSESGDPVRENKAALLALAIYLGDPRFDKLVGQVLSPALLEQSSFTRGVRLGGRPDLCLHFVISAGLKLLTDQGISTAIGEFKELLDAGRGGSGFSFADLAADRAGIRFAETASDTGGGARRLQKIIAGNPREELFFPPVADLPENMPREEFEQRYGGVGSDAYDRMVKEIDRRLDRCPAYGNPSL